MTIEERFAHVTDDDKAAAVAGLVRVNPGYDGVDFYTMMDILLDADAHLELIGDVVVEGEAASLLVARLAALGT
jgi:hypothetical protein